MEVSNADEVSAPCAGVLAYSNRQDVRKALSRAFV